MQPGVRIATFNSGGNHAIPQQHRRLLSNSCRDNRQQPGNREKRTVNRTLQLRN